MSEMREDMLRTLDRIVENTVTAQLRETADLQGQHSAGEKHTGFAAAEPLWSALEAAGFTDLGAAGGEGEVAFADVMEVTRSAGYHALPVPLGDVIIARRLRTTYGLADSPGICVSVPPGAAKDVVLAGGKVSGRVNEVPWGRDAASFIVAGRGPDGMGFIHLDCTGGSIRQGANMAGEPRDEIDLATAKLIGYKPVVQADGVLEAEGALLRAVQMSGALSATLAHCSTWVVDRVQFGKPIAKHQAIQHLMAQLAEEAAAASAAADLAVQASELGPDRFACAVAKARTGEAAGKAANLAHAIFGAMGFTREHPLHYSTRRLWAWRNEFGGETYWNGEIGRAVSERGGNRLWEMLTEIR